MDEEQFWNIYLIEKSSGDGYGIDFVPFHRILRYPVEGYQEIIALVGDIIWDLTFNGWTIEQQNKRIDEVERRMETTETVPLDLETIWETVVAQHSPEGVTFELPAKLALDIQDGTSYYVEKDANGMITLTPTTDEN